ncbi:MAG: L-histidine N(alpha)-methyltransferase [Candidatus Binatia bacterium]
MLPPGTMHLLRSLPAGGESPFALEKRPLPNVRAALARDARRGLAGRTKSLPPKYFYDERGSRLFDAICDLPEYYLTRTETALLERHAADVIASSNPQTLIELGAGTSRKTRLLLAAAARARVDLLYVPIDVCEEVLRETGEELVREFPRLRVQALVADYERERLPDGPNRLVAFLGSTIGNLDPAQARRFLKRLGEDLRPGEHLLLGADLVKPVERLEAAYNDSAGVTAEFNRNLLRVLNRELDGDFPAEAFEHVAFFDRRKSRIEMHLRARQPLKARLKAIDLVVALRAGETIHTEVSRKFKVEGLDRTLANAGFSTVRWYLPADVGYALVLAERV